MSALADDLARAAWLDWRRRGVGASDVAAILGISPWASPWSVWADKCGLLPPEPENEAMTAGRWLEAAIGPWFTHETGLHVAGEQTWCTHRELAHHRCTVDGFVVERGAMGDGFVVAQDPLAALGVLEIKVTGPGRRWDDIPAHYVAQVQWQMHVTGLDRAWLAVLMGRRLDVHEVERDQGDIALMVERADQFWDQFVAAGTPPPTDGHDATLRAIGEVYPDHVEGLAVEAGDRLRLAVKQWRLCKADKRQAADDEKDMAAVITAALGVAEELTIDGERAVSWRTQSARRLDTKSLAAAHPDIAAEFTVESTTRVLRNHAPKERNA